MAALASVGTREEALCLGDWQATQRGEKAGEGDDLPPGQVGASQYRLLPSCCC